MVNGLPRPTASHTPQFPFLPATTISAFQTRYPSLPNALPAMLGLHVEAGKTYFVRGRLARYYQQHVAVLDLALINEDEGRYLVSMSKRSLFTRR
jgi:hypothetical protein